MIMWRPDGMAPRAEGGELPRPQRVLAPGGGSRSKTAGFGPLVGDQFAPSLTSSSTTGTTVGGKPRLSTCFHQD
jgi:hypothetical protein